MGRASLETLPFFTTVSVVSYLMPVLSKLCLIVCPQILQMAQVMRLFMKYPNKMSASPVMGTFLSLSGDIDSRITTQMFIFLFTLEIGFAGINISFISIFNSIH